MISQTFWLAFVPLGMLYNFVGPQSQELDAYLAKRYGAEFEEWAAKTKRVIPFVI